MMLFVSMVVVTSFRLINVHLFNAVSVLIGMRKSIDAWGGGIEAEMR